MAETRGVAVVVMSSDEIGELRDSLVRIETALAWQWQEQQKARKARISNGARAAQNARLYEQGADPVDLDAPGA